jgi:hypothetical protein
MVSGVSIVCPRFLKTVDPIYLIPRSPSEGLDSSNNDTIGHEEESLIC